MHRLEPLEGRPYLDPEEIARRLREEFASCEVDAEQGQEDVREMLAKLREMRAPKAVIDQVAAGRDRSLRITVADESGSDDSLSFMVRPDDAILIGYFSAEHQTATRPLVERCALALGYEVVPL
jgi:hypothetical protein